MDGFHLLLLGAFVGLVLAMIILKPHPPIITSSEYSSRDGSLGGGCSVLIIVIATIIAALVLAGTIQP